MLRPAASVSKTPWIRARRGIVVFALLAWAVPSLVWGQDGEYSGVFGQRFADPDATATTTTTTSTTTTTFPPGCAPAPLGGCRQQTMERRGGISLKDSSPDTRDRLRWKWVRGSETSVEDLGDPLGGETDYALCVYDASKNPQPLSRQLVPGGGMCPGRPCWKQVGAKRFEYRHQRASNNFLRVLVKAAGEGKARLGVIGRGIDLNIPQLPLEPPVTVQFQASNGECWGAQYSAFIRRNEEDRFRAKPETTKLHENIVEIIDWSGDGAGNPLDNPRSIAVDGGGNVYVVGGISDNAFKITPGGVVTEIIDPSGDGAGNPLDAPSAVAVDGDGNVYVVGRISDNAFKITPGGVVTEIIDSNGDGAGNPLDAPSAVAVDGDENVYVTGFLGDNAFKITPGGVVTEIIDSSGNGAGNPLDAPSAVAVDGDGNVYVTGVSSNNAFKITPGGVITEIINFLGDGELGFLITPSAVAVDGDGNVYVASSTLGGGVPWLLGGNAFKITPGGVITEIIDENGDGGGNMLGLAMGIAVDGGGNVYVVGDDYSNNAFRITPGGGIAQIIDQTGRGTGHPLRSPQGIAMDGDGNVYVVGADSDNAFKIGPMGSPSGAFLDVTTALFD